MAEERVRHQRRSSSASPPTSSRLFRSSASRCEAAAGRHRMNERQTPHTSTLQAWLRIELGNILWPRGHHTFPVPHTGVNCGTDLTAAALVCCHLLSAIRLQTSIGRTARMAAYSTVLSGPK